MKIFTYFLFVGCLGWAAFKVYLIFTYDDGLIALYGRILGIVLLLGMSIGLLKEINVTLAQQKEKLGMKYNRKSIWYFIFIEGTVKFGLVLGFTIWVVATADFSGNADLLSNFLIHMVTFLIIGSFFGWSQWKDGKKQAGKMGWDKV